MDLVSLRQLVSRLPGADPSLLNRRIRRWTDLDVLKAELGSGRERKARWYAPSEVYIVAIAQRLTDAGLNPILLPQIITLLREALTKRQHIRSWEAAKRGAQQYLIVYGMPVGDDIQVMLDIRDDVNIADLVRRFPGLIAIDLKAAFGEVRE
jgi:hypothetical protein